MMTVEEIRQKGRDVIERLEGLSSFLKIDETKEKIKEIEAKI